jgi:YVTN family beta-propeller protein
VTGKKAGPERFLTTVLMTDIVGSTEHAAELGDSAWRELVQQHHSEVRASLRRHGGREIDTAGDGFFATFDAPATAVQCALELVERVRDLGIDIRAGVHVGEVEQVGSKVAGITVPIASRIMAAANPGEVLASSTVRELAAGSGLRFEDRGQRELKGVPGSWSVFAAQPAEGAEELDVSSADARERRAAAVRRARSRPVWQRRPRLVAAAVIGLTIVVAGSALLVWKPWQQPALASVAENSIGIIDRDRNELLAEIPVGLQPSGIAVGDGYAWVTNAADDTVSQIDLERRIVINRIPVGRSPTAIVAAAGSIWVANTGGRTVSRINVATGRVAQEVEVGNAPRAIVVAGDGLWVANSTDSTIQRIDPASGVVEAAAGVGANPVAFAADASTMWVASEDLASVSQIDPRTGATIAIVQLGVRPAAMALGTDWLWVASSDGTLSWIDTEAYRVSGTVPVGVDLTAVVLTGNDVWLGDRAGAVHRVDRSNPLLPPRRVTTTAAVHALAAVEPQGVWVATQPSIDSHRGGTLRVFQVRQLTHPTDPLGDPFASAAIVHGDGLVGYRRVGGAAGSTLLPNLATAIHVPGSGGLTYTFNLRRDVRYSTGELVLASDFRRAIERSFQVPSSFFGLIWGTLFYGSISGADACVPAQDGTPVERCDLSAGIVTNDATGTITFNLVQPDPDFLFKLASPYAYPVPDDVPMNTLVEGPFPVTGPYVVLSATPTEVHLVRNEHFVVWDATVRPDGFPDEIVFLGIDCPFGDCSPEASQAAAAAVENGEADVVPLARPLRVSNELLDRLSVQYPNRWHYGSVRTQYVVLNSHIPPFDSADARRAVNFALDRRVTGPSALPTCQLLPPGWPGYQPYCPYTGSADASGRWREPDLERARELVRSSGTTGMAVTVGPALPFFADGLDSIASVMTDLGYSVTIDTNTDDEHVSMFQGRTEATLTGWSPDYLAPSTFLGLFRCHADAVIDYCDPTGEFDALFQRALDLQTTDRAAANVAWAELDRWGVDQALLAPISNFGVDLVSDRVGNYQFSPTGVALYDQMWVQ